MKQLFVLSLFFLALTVSKVNTLPLGVHFGSDISFLKSSNQDSITLSILRKRIKDFVNRKKLDSAIIYSKKMLAFSKQISHHNSIAEANFRLGYYHKKNGDLQKAFSYYNDSFKILRDMGDSTSAASRLTSMANIQKGLGDFVGSKITAIDGLNYLKRNTDYRTQSSLEHIISVCLRELKDYKKDTTWNEKALVSLKKIKTNTPYSNRVIIKNTKATILADRKKYSESIAILSVFLSDTMIVKSPKEYARILSNLGHIKWLKDKNNLVSDSLFREALSIREEINDSQGLIASNVHLTKYYFEKDRSKALKHAEDAYSNAVKRESLPAILEALGYVFQLKKNTNTEAKTYHKVSEKLKRINQQNKEAYAITKFENDKLIEDNAKKNKQVLTERNQKTKYLFGLVIVCLLTFFITYFFTQRSKHLRQLNKTAKLEATFETESILSRRLHDDFGAKLNHGMSLVQNNADKSMILDALDNAYQQSRDFSREINEVDTGASFSEELLGMLGSRKAPEVKLFVAGLKEVHWNSIDPLTKITLYKILQELMINMGKHSRAEQVSIVFKKTAKALEISYADDGMGASKISLTTKNGLRNTEKRIEAIGGTITFDSETGKGFHAEIKIPK